MCAAGPTTLSHTHTRTHTHGQLVSLMTASPSQQKQPPGTELLLLFRVICLLITARFCSTWGAITPSSDGTGTVMTVPRWWGRTSCPQMRLFIRHKYQSTGSAAQSRGLSVPHPLCLEMCFQVAEIERTKAGSPVQAELTCAGGAPGGDSSAAVNAGEASACRGRWTQDCRVTTGSSASLFISFKFCIYFL